MPLYILIIDNLNTIYLLFKFTRQNHTQILYYARVVLISDILNVLTSIQLEHFVVLISMYLVSFNVPLYKIIYTCWPCSDGQTLHVDSP